MFSALQDIGFIKNIKQLIKIYDNDNYSISDVAKLIAKHHLDNSADSPLKLLKQARIHASVANQEIIRDIFDMYSNNQLVDIFIDYKTGTYAQLRPNKPWPFSHDLENIVFNIEPNREISNRNVRHVNLESNVVNVEHLTNLEILSAENNRSDYYYHTTSWNGALSLCNQGPLHHMGRLCLDFGVTPSFYTTPSLEVACEWAQKQSRMWNYERAIVVFSFKKQESGLKVLNIKTANRQWAALVSASRKCVGGGSILNEMDNYDLVCGPMLANPREVINGSDVPKAHIPFRVQLASKTKESDNMLKRSIIAVIWLKS
jgi:hypothetical protein